MYAILALSFQFDIIQIRQWRYTFSFFQKAKINRNFVVDKQCFHVLNKWKRGLIGRQARAYERTRNGIYLLHNALSVALFLITALIKLKTHSFFPFGLCKMLSLARWCRLITVYISKTKAWMVEVRAREKKRYRKSEKNGEDDERKCETAWIDCDFLNVVAMSSRLPFLDGLWI